MTQRAAYDPEIPDDFDAAARSALVRALNDVPDGPAVPLCALEGAGRGSYSWDAVGAAVDAAAVMALADASLSDLPASCAALLRDEWRPSRGAPIVLRSPALDFDSAHGRPCVVFGGGLLVEWSSGGWDDVAVSRALASAFSELRGSLVNMDDLLCVLLEDASRAMGELPGLTSQEMPWEPPVWPAAVRELSDRVRAGLYDLGDGSQDGRAALGGGCHESLRDTVSRLSALAAVAKARARHGDVLERLCFGSWDAGHNVGAVWRVPGLLARSYDWSDEPLREHNLDLLGTGLWVDWYKWYGRGTRVSDGLAALARDCASEGVALSDVLCSYVSCLVPVWSTAS